MKIFANDEEFNESISSGVTVVDVFATWCGPCQILAPVFEEVAQEQSEKADFGKLDVDLMPEMAQKYEISTVPTILVFKNGALVDRVSAVLPKDTLTEMVTKYF